MTDLKHIASRVRLADAMDRWIEAIAKGAAMALTPKNITDTNLHRLWDMESPMSDDEKISKLFANELKCADAVQAAMNRLDRIMHEKPEIDLRDLGRLCYEFKGTFRG